MLFRSVAVPFIDRHIGEGRGARLAIRTIHGEDVTYAQLAERVNRAGNALLALGLKPGDRLMMVVKDCPEFFYIFWGAIKSGIVPVPINTLLRADDYRFMIDDSACAALIYSPEYAAEVEPAVAAAKLSSIAASASHGPAMGVNARGRRGARRRLGPTIRREAQAPTPP